MGGWSDRTLAEDVDLTWSLYQAGLRVRFVPEAVALPVEPPNFAFLRRQLRRWSHGFVQNLGLHWGGVLTTPMLRALVAVAMWDATVASVGYLLLLPLLSLLVSPLFLLGYVIDLPAVVIPVLVGAAGRREIRRALVSLPAFFVLRTVNAVFFLRALYSELLLRRPLLVYEKGH